MTTEKLVKSPERRIRRTALDPQGRLRVKGKDPNYEYRIVNAKDERIEDLQERGYIFETANDVSVGGSRVDNTSRLGKVHEISVGQGLKAVLMKQRREDYEEDQAIKQQYVDKTEEAMKPSPDGGYGQVYLGKS